MLRLSSGFRVFAWLYVKYTNPSMSASPFESAALDMKQDLPQHCLDTSSLLAAGYECVAVEIELG